MNGHTHSFTPSGNIASTSGGTDNKTADAGKHSHTRGTMNIKGFIGDLDRWRGQLQNENALAELGITTNAFYNSSVTLNSDGKDGDSGNVKAAMFDASRSWSGSTSEESSHTHTAYFTGTEGTTGGNSGDTTSVQPTFSGSADTTSSNDTNGIENRPTNYTIRIWKRTA